MEGKVLKLIYRCDRIIELIKSVQKNGKKVNELNVFVLDSPASDLLQGEKSWYQVRQLTGDDKGKVFNVLEEWGEDFFALHNDLVHIMINGHTGLYLYSQMEETNATKLMGSRATIEEIEEYRELLTLKLNSEDKNVKTFKKSEEDERGN